MIFCDNVGLHSMYDELLKLSHQFLKLKNLPYRRYFIRTQRLAHRMSLIVGPRGVGKTTTVVQLLLDNVAGDLFDPRVFYVQADHFLMESTSLYEVAELFLTQGGKWIAFDEIHKYPNWSKELKSIYDTFEDLTIFASGSSALEIHKGSHDLTRRMALYHMQGMSFREYLELKYAFDLPVLQLPEICTDHEALCGGILKTLKKANAHVIPEFHNYMKNGYYPYFNEINDEAVYKMTLEQNVRTTIESDLSSIYPSLSGSSIHKIKKLLMFIANAVPFIPNWNNMMSALDIGDLRTLKTYFSHLEDAGLVKSVANATKKMKALETTGKIYLENPNQLYAIASEEPDVGTVRETFFFNQVSQKAKVTLPMDGDFLVEDHYLFEVGGRKKKFNQIKAEKNAYLALDDMEVGAGGKLPLWLFGFLY